MHKIKPHQNWLGYYNNDIVPTNIQLSIPSILESIEQFPIVHKDGARSFVSQGQLFGLNVIAKQARDKHRRPSARFLSLIRDGEAKNAFVSLIKFKQLGIESVNPVCVLENRRFGMIIDSWLIYEFREGETSTKKNLPQIVDVLQKLHSNGFCHNDPVLGNFMVGPDGTLFLIDCVGRSRRGYYSDYLDIMTLAKNNKDAGIEREHVTRIVPIRYDGFQQWLGFQLANIYISYKSTRAKWKKKIKRNRVRNSDAKSYRR
jgi:tRNA A-37 threonylcarbamoyl transferase component Bud32